MSQNQKLTLIQPLVNHLMQMQGVAERRRELTDAGVMDLEEVMALSPEALAAAFKTLKTLELMNAHPDQIMKAIDKHNLCWNVELDDDYRHGVTCY